MLDPLFAFAQALLALLDVRQDAVILVATGIFAATAASGLVPGIATTPLAMLATALKRLLVAALLTPLAYLALLFLTTQLASGAHAVLAAIAVVVGLVVLASHGAGRPQR
jgi:mannose/fructose/N-acetylgalactosamine-specific phosphotransferase system component IID